MSYLSNTGGLTTPQSNAISSFIALAQTPAGNHLAKDATGNFINSPDTGGSATPGGSNTQLQYNNAGAMGGISGATTNGTLVTFITTGINLADSTDTTKKVAFALSGLTTGTTRTLTIPDASGTVALTSNNLGAFAATTSAQLAAVLSDETGTGTVVFNTSPTLVTPILGTPTSVTLTNGTGLPISTGVSGLGTGVATFLGTPSSANLATALTDKTGTGVNVFGTTPTITTPVINGTVTGTGVATTATASTLAQRDANANLTINNLVEGYQTIVGASGTTTLTVSSPFTTFITGTLPQTVVLPAATTLVLNTQFRIHSNSSGVVTIQTNGGATLWTMAANTDVIVTCTDTSTAAGVWDVQYLAISAVTGKKVSVSNSINLAGTDSTTMTFPSTSATIARTDAGQVFTGVNTFTSPKFITNLTDTNGLAFITINPITSAVNAITVSNAATAGAPKIAATGTDTNIELQIDSKGTGLIKHNHATYQGIVAASDGATITFDMSLGNTQSVTMAGNRTLALSNVQPGQVFMLRLTQDATGTRVPTFFTTIKWAGGVAPTLTTTANKTDVFGFICTSAGNYDGFVVGQNI